MRAAPPQAAKDIDTKEFLGLVRQVMTPIGASLWNVLALRPDWPEKVVRAKARSLIRQGYIDGCACGCRGDFTLEAKGEALLCA